MRTCCLSNGRRTWPDHRRQVPVSPLSAHRSAVRDQDVISARSEAPPQHLYAAAQHRPAPVRRAHDFALSSDFDATGQYEFADVQSG